MIVGNLQVYSLPKFVEEARSLARLMRNEYLLRDPRGFPETIYHRIEMLQASNEVKRTVNPETNSDQISIN